MTLVRLVLFAPLLLVCFRCAAADQKSQDQEKRGLDILKQVMQSNVDALRSGCILDSKWFFSERHRPMGPDIPFNSERSARVAIKGEYLLTKTWFTGRYDLTSHGMIATNEREVRAAFAGQKYIQTNDLEYLVSKNPANIGAVFDVFSAYPLTAMFQFLVPRQGYVTFHDVASPSNWSAYISDITHISFDDSGNLIVTTLRSDGIGQEVTFSAMNGFYPSKIKMRWDDNEDVFEVVDWAKTDVFGNNVRFVPTVITALGGKKEGAKAFGWKITLDSESIAKVPETAHYFTLPVAGGSLIHDMDIGVDVPVPQK